MSCLGGYPWGAEHDPRAPYNWPDPEMVECPDCHGCGSIFYARDLRTGAETAVTEAAWSVLPESEDDARRLGQNYFRSDECECGMCEGTGQVESEADCGPDPDDAYERYLETKYEREHGNDR